MTPTPGRWYRSRAAASPHTGRHRPTKVFWNLPRRATSRYVGPAAPVFVTAVRAGWFWGRSSTARNHSTNPPMATFSSVAPNRLATSSSICEPDQGLISQAAPMLHSSYWTEWESGRMLNPWYPPRWSLEGLSEVLSLVDDL